MSKYKVINNVHTFLTKIDGKEFADFSKLRLEAKALRRDLEAIFHFSASQPAVEAGAESRCPVCGCEKGHIDNCRADIGDENRIA